ncbi:MAG: hypothetical protein C0604_09530, partial [Clostridiales bacterium]
MSSVIRSGAKRGRKSRSGIRSTKKERKIMSIILKESIVLIISYFSVFFIVALIIKNNSIVDIGWGIGFVLVAWYSMARGGNYTETGVLATVLVTVWGLRLFYHI